MDQVNLDFVDNKMVMRTADHGANIDSVVGFGTLIDYNLNEYKATEIEFHTPADHRLRGKRADMEL